MPNEVVVKNAGNKTGSGVFALREFKKNEEVITSKIVNIFENPTKWTIENNSKHYLLEKPFMQVNHSCDPNCKIHWANNLCMLVAVKNINKNNEITFDYTTTETNITQFSKCMCNSTNCRRTLSNSTPLERFLDFSGDNYFEEMQLSEENIMDALMNRHQLFFRGGVGITIEKLMSLMKVFFQENTDFDPTLSKLEQQDLYAAFTPFGLEKINNNKDLKATLDIFPKNSLSYYYYELKEDIFKKNEKLKEFISQEFYHYINKINLELLKISSQFLHFIIYTNIIKLEEEIFLDSIKEPNYLTRLIHYKPISHKSHLALGEHVDDDLFALVFNHSSKSNGLEILNPENKWIEVQIPRYSFILLPGRLLEFMSSGRVKAIKHRVRRIDDNERLTINFNYGIPEKHWSMNHSNRKLRDFYFETIDSKYKISA